MRDGTCEEVTGLRKAKRVGVSFFLSPSELWGLNVSHSPKSEVPGFLVRASLWAHGPFALIKLIL